MKTVMVEFKEKHNYGEHIFSVGDKLSLPAASAEALLSCGIINDEASSFSKAEAKEDVD